MGNTIKGSSLPLWRVDAGYSDDESSLRRTARAADAHGNRDGRVSLDEADRYDAEVLKPIYGHQPTTGEFADQPAKQDAWERAVDLRYVKDEIKEPESLAWDVTKKLFGKTLEKVAALWWFGGRIPE